METSLQFGFINNQYGYSISFVQGHKLMSDIATIHNIGPHAYDFYNKIVVASVQLVNFLKPGEHLGFYIDSEEPYFRFKIEMNNNGSLRTLLLPEDFSDFPKTFTGKCRLTKIMPGKAPYTSILDYQDFPLENIVNEIMDKSYQTNSHILLSKDTFNSLMLTKLPPTNINKKIDDYEDLTLAKMLEDSKELIEKALDLKTSDIKITEELFNQYGFSYLGSKEIRFNCPCSKERMVENLFTLRKEDIDDLFSAQASIETRCDYCNTIYEIKKEEVIKNLQ